MKFNPKEIKTIVTHKHCPDGLASAMLLKDALPHAEVTFVSHDELAALPAVPGMIFCDIAPLAERTDEFLNVGAYVLDHHKSAKVIVAAFGDRGVFADERDDPGVSGAVLAYREVWQEMNPSGSFPVEEFAVLAGIRDTWQTQHPRWDEACSLSAALMFFGANYLVGKHVSLTPLQISVGKMLIEKRKERAVEIVKSSMLIRGKIGIFNDAPDSNGVRLISDVGEEARQIPVICGFFLEKSKTNTPNSMSITFSLRSHGGIDVSLIASMNGGGGHTAAAGFRVDPAHTSVLLHLNTALGIAGRGDLLE